MEDYCCVADREHAVEVVAQVYERIKIQQPLLILHCPPSTTTQLAQTLLSEALRALNVALSVMKQQQQQSSSAPATPISIKAEPPSHGGAAPDPEAITTSAARRGKRRRTTMEAAAAGKTSSSWAGLTTVPYEDGYEWRKYGEKKINGTSFTRSYFRCTYKDDTGCLATKHVQLKDSISDPPVFQVTYNNKHTCNNYGTSATTTAANKSSDDREINIINPHPLNAAAVMNNNVVVKQEPPAVLVLPPLVEASSSSALAFYHQTPPPPCQHDIDQPSLIPIGGMQQQQPCGTATDYHTPSTTSSSCISGDSSCDGYYYSAGGDMMAQMAAEEASPGQDFLPDLELFLLCDSFKDY
ncbi:probable WRKY transcription factor 70 [Panicum virgatum]|uniref:WRKY domain-containing protein n=1 Tax=Panicum virgatum TaxID=38727 RepID=A0A8T0PKN4_PANVG|nr:probable WRKY transcription factor 70 [Panicum virgatum]KAG2559666.1 hypothetical protein PVAP13_8KG022600 [Panicum virgatum]